MVPNNPLTSISVVCRDSNSIILHDNNYPFYVGLVEIVEAMAIKEACSIVSRNNWPYVIIEKRMKLFKNKA